MGAFLIRRAAGSVIMLLLVAMATFAIFFLVPKLAGTTPEGMASRYLGRTADAQTARLAAERLGFDDPLHEQFWRFLKGVAAGAEYDYGPGVEHCPAPCLGYSFITQQAVWPELLDRLPVTISVAAGASVLWLAGGIAIGALSALRRGTLFDRMAMGIALAGVSLPTFFSGLLALVVFSYGLGITAPGGSYTPITENPLEWAYNLILPWVTLAFITAAAYARHTRAGMLETMGEDFVRTARAKGLPERKVVVRHGLRAALTPIVTIFGMDVALLLGGAVITESTFSLPGIGKYAVDAIVNQDLPKVMGVTLVGAVFLVVANLVVDVLYAVVDPRVRIR
ncbi:ABC transporter permease [Nonomuraea sp. NBC_01738]|uniref:ABC transporter permease n=1 Tax=Nonomuraea sp. NBC_01738 TaxID=2976003 RepID=UPI002E145153|nr:ABC transporter permease [Nonomuraea sp. NBC_01738]